MAAYDSEVTDADKAKIVSNFILNSPPGEFNEVFNDARILLNNDNLLREGASHAIASYNKEQLTPVKVQDGSFALITEYNDLDGTRFVDPRSKVTFRYDHLRKEASNFQPWNPDSKTESWRNVLEHHFTSYVEDHYKNGHCSVFAQVEDGGRMRLTACVEDHQFQSQNYWNGRWRSVWSVVLDPNSSSIANLQGILKVQVHYYEDGNVQLQAKKEIKEALNVGSEQSTAKEFVYLVERAENECHTAIADNYQTMSETTFKALRRQLPVTRTKIDWVNIKSYNVGKQLRSQ